MILQMQSAELIANLSIALEIGLIILLIATCIAIFSIRSSVKTIEEMYYNFNKDEYRKREAEKEESVKTPEITQDGSSDQ